MYLEFRFGSDVVLALFEQVNRWRLNPIANPLIELLTGIKILIVKSKNGGCLKSFRIWDILILKSGPAAWIKKLCYEIPIKYINV